MAALTAVTLFAACTTPDGPLPTTEETPGPAVAADLNEKAHDQLATGGDLATAVDDIVPQFNRWHVDANDASRELWDWYNPVTQIVTPQGETRPDPDYITRIEAVTVDGNTEVTYDINDRARFNDGTPIDWRAFRAVVQACGSGGRGCAEPTGYDRVAEVSPGVDDKQAVVRFAGTYPAWEGLFDRLLHPDAVAEFDTAYRGQAHPEWGAGPYKVEYIDATADKAAFVPNEKWWGDPAPLTERRFVGLGAREAATAVLRGTLDAAPIPNAQVLERAQNAADLTVRTGSSVEVKALTLNALAPPLDDPAVRDALMMGTDRRSLAEIMFAGIEYREPLPGSFVLLADAPGHRDNFAAAVPFDVQRAGQVLDGAGWTPGPDGIREKDGRRLALEVLIPPADPAVAAAARAHASMMRDIGIALTITEVPRSEIDATVAAGDHQIALTRVRMTPHGVRNACRMWCPEGTQNATGITDPEVTALVTEEMMRQRTTADQIRVANNAETTAFTDHGILPLYRGPDLWMTRKGLANVGARAYAQPRIEDIGWVR